VLRRAANQLRSLTRKVREWGAVNPLAFIAGLIALVVFILIVIWTDKDFWDWMELLIVPVMVALGLFWLRQREDRRDEERQEQETERQIDSQHQDTLQNYFDKMSELLLKEQLGENNTQQEGEEASNSKAVVIARARTLAVLRSLDPTRVASTFHFLVEAGLRETVTIAGGNLRKVDWHGTSLLHSNLREARLTGADLSGANLNEADLRGAYLFEANLSGAYLFEANLGGADLSKANLSKANLSRADLSKANLGEANLSGAHLDSANLGKAHLFEANLCRANLLMANLSAANLRRADLSMASLVMANLSAADLRGAHLSGAHLDSANLDEADLGGATYNTKTRWPNGFNPDTEGAMLSDSRYPVP